MNEKLKEIKRLHDILKDNPFWLNFDIRLYKDVLRLFGQLSSKVYSSSDNTNPCYTIIRSITHDFNCTVRNEMYAFDNGNTNKVDGNIIIMLQTYLTLVHGLFDRRDLSDIYGYTCRRFQGNYDLATFKAIYDEDKKEYYAVNVLPESKREVIVRLCKKEMEKSHRESCKMWWHEALTELKEGRKEVKKFWLFKS